MKIYAPKDCHNSTKRKVIYEANLAYANSDLDKIGTLVADDFEMEFVGESTVYGWSNVQTFLSDIVKRPNAIFIRQIITHGKYAAAHGRFVFDAYELAFNHFYEFTSASSLKIKKITAYVIELNK